MRKGGTKIRPRKKRRSTREKERRSKRKTLLWECQHLVFFESPAKKLGRSVVGNHVQISNWIFPRVQTLFFLIYVNEKFDLLYTQLQ